MIFLLGLCAFVVAWILPGHHFPWVTVQQETFAAGGALLTALSVVVTAPERRLRVPTVAWVAVAVAAIPLAQWALGQQSFLADALIPSLYLAGFAILVISGCTQAATDRRLVIGGLHGAIVTAALISSAIGFHQWLEGAGSGLVEQLTPGDRVFANFTQPNQFALLLGFALVSTAWMFEKRHLGAISAGMLALLFGFCMVMTQSRAGWTFVIVIAVWCVLARRAAGLRLSPTAVGLAGLVFTGLTFAWGPLNTWLGGGTATVLGDRLVQVGTRTLHWETLWQAVLSEPWFGYGFLQVPAAQMSAVLSQPAPHEWVTYSHNAFLDLAVWMGLPLAIGLSVLIAAWLWLRGRACADADVWSMLALVGVFLMQSMVEFPYAYLYFLLPVALAVGATEGLLHGAALPRPQGRERFGIPKWSVLAATGCMAGLLALTINEYLLVEEEGRRARFKEAGYDFDGKPPSIPEVWLVDTQRELLWFRITAAKPDMAIEDLNRMQRVAHRFLPPAALLRYALAAGLNGRPADARRFIAYICATGTRRNCEDGREAWQLAQAKYPQLAAIPFEPASP